MIFDNPKKGCENVTAHEKVLDTSTYGILPFFADHKFKVGQMNNVRQSKRAGCKHFHNLQKCFHEPSFPKIRQLTHLTHVRYIAVENIVRKGEIACNKQFFLTMFSTLYRWLSATLS